MRAAVIAATLFAVVVSCVVVDSGYAEGTEAFQLALFNPIQLRDESSSIFALRLNLIYGKNVSVTGLDLGLVNRCTGGTSVGLQHGLVGYVEGSFAGWQNNVIDIVKDQFTGLQSGLYNQMGSGAAVQYGAVNVAESISGLELGLVNYTETMHGLQIGLINVIRQKEKLPVLPILNWSF